MWTHFPDHVTYRFTEIGGWNRSELGAAGSSPHAGTVPFSFASWEARGR
jgi:hypothetical protein